MPRATKKFTKEEAKRRWEARAAAFSKVQTKSFRGAMAVIWNMDRTELDRQVYGTAKPGARSGLLRNAEKMRIVNANMAVITNTAASVWKGVTTFYAWIVHSGTKTRDKGKQYYCWMLDPREERPTTWEGWKQAQAEGRARMAHKLKAIPARRWRSQAMKDAKRRGVRASHWRKANKELWEQK